MNSDLNNAQHRWVVCTVCVHCAHAACHVACKLPCRSALGALSPRARLATLLAWPGRDTKSKSRQPFPLPRPGLVATPNPGRDPLETKPCQDIHSHVATPFQSTVRLFNRDTPVAPLCRDASRHQIRLPYNLRVATPKPCHDTPRLPLLQHEKSCLN